MKRRDFLSLTAKSFSLMALNELLTLENALASSNSGQDQFFVQIYLEGGWDVTLGTNPWLAVKPDEKDMFIEYDPSTIQRDANLAFGPALLPMLPFADRMAVINGIFLSENDNGHPAAEQYIFSGSINQLWGSLVVEYGECRGEEFLGTLTNGRINVGSRTPTLTPIEGLSSLSVEPLTGFYSDAAQKSRLTTVEENMQKEISKFKRMKEILDGFTKQGLTLTDHHSMAATMSAGLAQTAMYTAKGGFLDTHSGHVQAHLTNQTDLWKDVANLLNVFKNTPFGSLGESMLDRTTFFVTSEFARTAALNNAQGKDHNPLTNSVVIVSPKVKSTTIGGSRLVTRHQSANGNSYHIASPIDLKTGQALDTRTNAFIIRPENVAASVAELMGISRKRFAPVKSNVPSLTHLLRR